MINVCVPTLKRYDLLREMLRSLEQSALKPDRVFIIDNGRDARRLNYAISSINLATDVYTPNVAMSVAESWNWFMRNVPQERVIVNDDILFRTDSLEKLLAADLDLAWAEGCGFSCYVLRDKCIEVIGYFDEAISPGYGYYEDDDYLQRLDGRGTKPAVVRAGNVKCGVLHVKSATLKANTNAEMEEHHRRFLIAQENYARKWNVVFP